MLLYEMLGSKSDYSMGFIRDYAGMYRGYITLYMGYKYSLTQQWRINIENRRNMKWKLGIHRGCVWRLG